MALCAEAYWRAPCDSIGAGALGRRVMIRCLFEMLAFVLFASPQPTCAYCARHFDFRSFRPALFS